MTRHISDALGQEVLVRSGGRCEYCQISIADTFFGGEIDHVLSVKHGGLTESENLALACQPCNRHKGSDIGSISANTGEFIRFYNPRIDVWSHHFRLDDSGILETLSEVGQVTAAIFRFNDFERVHERLGLMELGNYDTPRD